MIKPLHKKDEEQLRRMLAVQLIPPPQTEITPPRPIRWFEYLGAIILVILFVAAVETLDRVMAARRASKPQAVIVFPPWCDYPVKVMEGPNPGPPGAFRYECR